jgi:hypothetical protein
MSDRIDDLGTDPTRQFLDELDDAGYASLSSRAVSDDARAFTDYLTGIIATWERQSDKWQRQRSIDKVRAAVEAFVGDLLLALDNGRSGWVYRSVRPTSFSGEHVSSRIFRRVLEGLKATELVQHLPGSQYWADFGDGAPVVSRQRAPRFRAAPKLLVLAAQGGITSATVSNHFTPGLPQHPLVLKTTSRRVGAGKDKGKRMPLPRTARAAELEDQIRMLNEFLDNFTLRGGTHRGFVRVFNNADDEGFDWNMGGRLYSAGKDSYQTLGEDERLNMTIDGEVVCEIDIRASYLTILHVRNHVPFTVSKEDDPYHIAGLDRFVVKNWIVICLGSKELPQRWPAKVRSEYSKQRDGRNLSKDYPIKGVGRMVIEKFPLLGRWSDLPDTWATLMCQESKAILKTMLGLMSSDIPSFPVHDSIIVPASQETVACELLSNHYREICGAIPALVVRQSTPNSVCQGLRKA